MTDALLTRLSTPAPEEARAKFVTPPWPEGFEPKVVQVDRDPNASLPKARAVLTAWTAAEKQALAAVLSPGKSYYDWPKYRKNWDLFRPHFTDRSPALDEDCLAQIQPVTINGIPTLLAGMNTHLATDDDTVPTIALWQQMIEEVGPELAITHGTAGGIGASTQLGDVFVCGSAKFNCTGALASKPWAQERFESFVPTAGPHAALFDQLVAGNARNLDPSLVTRAPALTFGGDVETVDQFWFADTDDSYGVVANDPLAHTEEMDDACAFLAVASNPAWSSIKVLSIRNASDPQMGGGPLPAQKEDAEQIYDKNGFTTTVISSVASVLVIADL